MKPHPHVTPEPQADWRKNRDVVRDGFKDLEYLPRSRTGWNATLAAYAYSARRQMAGTADLNLWAVMHGCPASARYQELGKDALVLWHGTSAVRAAQIAQHGLFHKRGLWTTLEPRIAHGYTRSRSQNFGAGSATVVLLLDRRAVTAGVHYDQESPEILRFYSGMPPESIEYILRDDRIEFLGREKAEQPKPWGTARFKRKGGRWVPLSNPPVRFDDEHAYGRKEDWLRLSIQRILSALGAASAVEVFSSLYSTIAPWSALAHEEVFDALERLCEIRAHRGSIGRLSLAREPGCRTAPGVTGQALSRSPRKRRNPGR
jgi:hypothetical protein